MEENFRVGGISNHSNSQKFSNIQGNFTKGKHNKSIKIETSKSNSPGVARSMFPKKQTDQEFNPRTPGRKKVKSCL